MVKTLRMFARRTLPDRVRKPLGSFLSPIEMYVARPLAGMIFDLMGGRYRTDDCSFAIPKHLTTRTYRACFARDDYENEERELIKRFVKAEDSVLEFGACLGVVACVTNQLLRNRSRHVVVEANPQVIPSLYQNRALNGAGFLIEHCAVSNKTEETFYLHPVFIVGGSSQRKTEFAVRLPGRSWRELDARYGPFATLIMDIEGSELDIFAASQDLLSKCRLVIVELHAWAIGEEGVQQCRDLMAAAGLHFLDRAGIIEAWGRD